MIARHPDFDGGVYVPLSRGLFAIIDSADVPLVSPHKWSVDNPKGGRHFYAHASLGRHGVYLSMHRLLAGATPDQHVDHANGDGLDNRRANLRVCTRSQNCGNSPKWNRTASRFKGVARFRDRWRSRCAGSGFVVSETEEGAARTYDAAARARWGPFACVNFPEVGERSALTGEIRQPDISPAVRTPALFSLARNHASTAGLST